MILWLAVALPPLLYLTWSLLAMEMRYRKASASLGVPLIRIPVNPVNPLWMIFSPVVWQVLDLFPFNYGSFRYTRRGWFFFDKSKTFQRLGPIWGIVTPKDVYLHLADPDATQRIFSRRLDYVRPSWLYSKARSSLLVQRLANRLDKLCLISMDHAYQRQVRLIGHVTERSLLHRSMRVL